MQQGSRTLNALARPDLKFPLSRHDLCVDTRDLDSSIQTGLVMSLNDVSAVDLACSNAAVIRPLGSWESSYRPAIWPAVQTKESVFLLQPKPRLLRSIGVHQPRGLMTIIEFIRSSVMVPAFTHDEDVVALAEGIGIDGDGAKVDIGVAARSLAAGGTVKIPF